MGQLQARFVGNAIYFKCSTCWEPRLVSTEMNWEAGVKRNNVLLTGSVAFKLLSFSHFTKLLFHLSVIVTWLLLGNHLPFWFYFWSKLSEVIGSWNYSVPCFFLRTLFKLVFQHLTESPLSFDLLTLFIQQCLMILHNVFFSLSVTPTKNSVQCGWQFFITSARGCMGNFLPTWQIQTPKTSPDESLYPVERKFLSLFQRWLFLHWNMVRGRLSPSIFFTTRRGILRSAHPDLLSHRPLLFPNFHIPALPGDGARQRLPSLGEEGHCSPPVAASVCLSNMNQTSGRENYNHTSKYLSDQLMTLEWNHGYFILFEGFIVVSIKKKEKNGR